MSPSSATDRIDREILGVLAQDARITNKDLAGRVGLSPSACLERVRRLTDGGALRGSHADVDPAAFGVRVQAFVAVQLKRHTRAAVARFERSALEVPQIRALYHVTGGTDYLALVGARDMEQLRDFTLDAISSLPDVARVETSLIFRATHKPGWPDLTEPG